MGNVIRGTVIGFLVFLILIFAFGGSSGPLELLVWVLLSVAVGVAFVKLVRLGEKRD